MTLLEATIQALQGKLIETKNDKIDRNLDLQMGDDYGLYQVDVYKICMDTYNGKRLYLAQTKLNITWKEAKSFEWVFNPTEGMEFDTEKEAYDFAKKYFKSFKNWYIYKTLSYRL